MSKKQWEDLFIEIKDVYTNFDIKEWSWFDVPYFSMNFNDNGRHYKINQKGVPMPKFFTKIKEAQDIVAKCHAIRTPTQAAVFVIEQFGIACAELSKEKNSPFKVIISEDLHLHNKSNKDTD